MLYKSFICTNSLGPCNEFKMELELRKKAPRHFFAEQVNRTSDCRRTPRYFHSDTNSRETSLREIDAQVKESNFFPKYISLDLRSLYLIHQDNAYSEQMSKSCCMECRLGDSEQTSSAYNMQAMKKSVIWQIFGACGADKQDT